MSEANEHPYKKITSTEPNLLNEHQQYIAQAEHHSLRQPNVKNFTEASYHPKFTWELCTTDPDNTENILVWRSISRMTPEDAIQNGNLSYRARNQAVVNPEMRSRETFVKQFDGQDISKIAENYVMVSGVKHDEPSPVLHTTYNPKNVSFVPHEGVIMEFSVPKQ